MWGLITFVDPKRTVAVYVLIIYISLDNILLGFDSIYLQMDFENCQRTIFSTVSTVIPFVIYAFFKSIYNFGPTHIDKQTL